MLKMIPAAVQSPTPEVTLEVRLLSVLRGEMTRQELKKALGLTMRRSGFGPPGGRVD